MSTEAAGKIHSVTVNGYLFEDRALLLSSLTYRGSEVQGRAEQVEGGKERTREGREPFSPVENAETSAQLGIHRGQGSHSQVWCQ